MFSNNYPGKAVHFLRVNYTKKRSKRQLTPILILAADLHGFSLKIAGTWNII
jgi:hypothetical protein